MKPRSHKGFRRVFRTQGDNSQLLHGQPLGAMQANGHVAWKDARMSKKEEIRGVIERLSKPSEIRSIFGTGLTEHAKKYGGPMDLADSVALDRRVDAKYAAREKAGKSKNPGNRRA